MAKKGYDPDPATTTAIPFADRFELENIAGVLASYAATLSNTGFIETASLVLIARLDLLSRLHGITDDELRSLASLTGFGLPAFRQRQQ